MGFEININFLIRPFFYITKKSGQQFKYLKSGKSFSHEVKSIFQKGPSLKQIKTTFLVGESLTLKLLSKYNCIKFKSSRVTTNLTQATDEWHNRNTKKGVKCVKSKQYTRTNSLTLLSCQISTWERRCLRVFIFMDAHL